MRHAAFFFVLALLLSGCPDNAEEKAKAEVAVLADLATRQLIAGLNDKNAELLAGLIVMTSTTGGPPRPLTAEELKLLVYPDGPYSYSGAGAPGTMVLLDGQGRKRVIRLIAMPGGKELKVLASSEKVSAVSDARVLTIMPDATVR